MKICVIGNSHLAALKLAWNDLKQNYFDELTFFGSGAQSLKNSLMAENNYLIPRTETVAKNFRMTSDGAEKIDVSQFDSILLHGLGIGIWNLGHALRSHRIYSSDSNNKVISLKCLRQICEDRVQQSMMFEIVELICSISNIPVFISCEPFPSQACLEDESKKWAYLSFHDGKMVQNAYYEGLMRVCKKFNAHLLPQPIETVVDFLFTPLSLSKGSVRLGPNLNSLHEETNYGHMNKEYGAQVLAFALSKMRQIVS